jgi:hypothetical protein
MARRQKFAAKDPYTTAHAAIRDLYTSGYFYDVEKNFRARPDEADTCLKPCIGFINDRIKTLDRRYNWVPDNAAKKTLIEAFVNKGVSKKGLEYADSWSGWLSVTWADY